MSSPPNTVDLTGQTLGHFRILGRIGAGGMGIVYRAFDEKLRRTVALKLLPPDFADDAERRRRFLREARAAAAVTHANVATVYEVGEVDERVFIAMEYVEGRTLRARMDAGLMPLDEVVRVAVGIARALAKAHDKGIVHRDLKPENVMIADDGDVKVLDFGLAKPQESEPMTPAELEAADTGHKTEEGRILGTPEYMSPEQGAGSNLDSRTDVFSFGTVLYEMTTRLLPFRGKSSLDVLVAITRDAPDPVSRLNPRVPPLLERVIDRCLAKDRTQRWANGRELLLAIEPLASTRELAPVSAAESAATLLDPWKPASTISHPTVSAAPSLGTRPTAILLVSAAVAVLAAGSVILLRRHPATETPPAVPSASAAAAGHAAEACVAFVSAGDTHTCARRTDGTVTCWGDNRFGQLGVGDAEKHAGPSRVDVPSVKIYVAAGQGDIESDQALFACAIKTDTTLWCWGNNAFGQLGTGGTDSHFAPVEVAALGAGVARASAGSGHACAQGSGGALYCWGDNAQGQLGIGTTASASTPTRVPAPPESSFDAVSAAGHHTCARRSDGSLWCWGDGAHGELGTGGTGVERKPVQVTALKQRVARFSAGGTHTCAVTTDGAAWCWGDNRYGQLGTSDQNARAKPSRVDADHLGTSVREIYAGGTHTCALLVDGTLWCWGGNASGQLGTGDTTPRAGAVQVAPAILSGVTAAHAGGAHTCAIRVDGSVWCWGSNEYGQLGAGTGAMSAEPTRVFPPCQQ